MARGGGVRAAKDLCCRSDNSEFLPIALHVDPRNHTASDFPRSLDPPDEVVDEDDDVAQERERIMSGKAEMDTLVLHELTKVRVCAWLCVPGYVAWVCAQ